MKALKIIGIVLGSIIGLVVVVVGVIWFLMSRTPSIAANMTDVASSPQSAAALDQKWEDFRVTVNQSPAGTTVSVAITEQEVTSKINEELKNIELPAGLKMGDVTVNLQDGKLVLAADISYSVFSGTAAMEATIEEVNGEAVVSVQNVDMGSLPIPQTLKDQLSGLIPEDGIIKLSDLPFDISKIQIVNGQIIIDGVKQ